MALRPPEQEVSILVLGLEEIRRPVVVVAVNVSLDAEVEKDVDDEV